MMDLNEKASQYQLNDRLSAQIRASNPRERVNGSNQESSEWKLMDFGARRQLCSTKAPDCASEKGEICDVRLYSESVQAFNNQIEHPLDDFGEFSSDPEGRDADSYDFQRQARLPSKAVSEVCSPHDSNNDVNGFSDTLGEYYGPFRISCREDYDSPKSRRFYGVEASSVYSSGNKSTLCNFIPKSSERDVQTLFSSEKELGFVKHKSKAELSLYDMLGIKFAQIDGRRVLTDARCKPLR